MLILFKKATVDAKKATVDAVLVIVCKLILFKSAKIADNSAKIVNLIESVFAYLAASTINIAQVRNKNTESSTVFGCYPQQQ